MSKETKSIEVDYDGLVEMMKNGYREFEHHIYIGGPRTTIVTEEIDFSYLLNILDMNISSITKTSNDKVIELPSLFFHNIVFKEKVYAFSHNFRVALKFKDVTFNKEVKFTHITFEKDILFEDLVKFKDEVSFSDSIFRKEVTFSHSKFEKKVKIDSSNFNDDVCFYDIKFCPMLKFSFDTFDKKLIFHVTNFTETSFSNITFKSDIEFRYSEFFEKLSFYDTSFHGRIDIIGITHKIILFNMIILSDKSRIYMNTLNSSLEKHQYKNAEIKIINTIISNRIDLLHAKFNIIDLKGSAVVGNGSLNIVDLDPTCENHQTATVLKNEAIKRNDIIKALEYKATEKNLYSIEKLLLPFKAIKSFFKNIKRFSLMKTVIRLPKNIYLFLRNTLKYTGDIVSIFLGKISNNHDQSWIRAIIFTIAGGFGLYYLFECRIDNTVKIEQVGVDFFEYLIPTSYNKLLSYKDSIIEANWSNILTMIIYIGGKIWIAYGVVQTVKAFRKFNKTN